MTSKPLVDAEKLLIALFDKDSRPCMRTIQEWYRNGVIPYYKLGQRIFFDLDEVRTYLERRNKIRAKL